MKKISIILLLFFLSFLFLFYSNAKSISKNVSNIKNDLKKTRTKNINSKLAYNISSGNIPLYFIQNRGQFNKKALFYARTSKYFIWITKKGLIFDSVKKNKEDKTQHSKLNTQNSTLIKRDVSRLLFKASNKSPEIVPIDTTNYKVNYFTGKDRSKWKTGISTSKGVVYKNIYPYIDLKVYGTEKQIEYDWIVRPGGDSCDIKFEFKDVKCTELDNKGNIIIKTEFGKIIHKKPSSYQIKEKGKRGIINAKFKRLKNNIYKFEIENYDKNKTLIIDPLVLLYSTYLGGNGSERGISIAVDSNGCAYITGTTESTDFPLKTPIMSYQGNEDAFITKFSTDGQSLIYSTYIGGSLRDYGRSIGVDANKCAYITGQTRSENFPLKNNIMSYQGDCDAFITKLSADGQSLIYSTYLGGGSYDSGNSIAVDANECVYITGYTNSTDFPLKNPFMSCQGNHNFDAFITKLSADGQSLVYSTCLGGNFHDCGESIAVDANECAYITGYTNSTDFPLKNPFMSYQGIEDAFVTKLSTDGQSLVYSTYLGGNSVDEGLAIAVDANECAYVTGRTGSKDFPTQELIMSYQGDGDAFVTKFSADGQSLVYSTYIGGGYGDSGNSIAVDANECAYITGQTSSTDFPTQELIMSYQGDGDAFVIRLSTDGQSLVYSTYIGGNDSDIGYGIAVDANGFTYITGLTESRDFPLKNPYMSDQGDGDAFVLFFKPFNPLIVLNISVARKTERAWIINRDYAELNFLVDNPSEVNVSKYVIYRKINNETYKTLYEFSDSSLNVGSYTYIDKFLDKDKTYTYKFIAYDSSNNIIAISNAISI